MANRLLHKERLGEVLRLHESEKAMMQVRWRVVRRCRRTATEREAAARGRCAESRATRIDGIGRQAGCSRQRRRERNSGRALWACAFRACSLRRPAAAEPGNRPAVPRRLRCCRDNLGRDAAQGQSQMVEVQLVAGQQELTDLRERCGALEQTAAAYEAQIRSLEGQVRALLQTTRRARC